MRKIVEKKVLPEDFDAIIRDKKKFGISKEDLQIGDTLVLREWDGEKYTGRKVERNIECVLRHVPEYGCLQGYIILGW